MSSNVHNFPFILSNSTLYDISFLPSLDVSSLSSSHFFVLSFLSSHFTFSLAHFSFVFSFSFLFTFLTMETPSSSTSPPPGKPSHQPQLFLDAADKTAEACSKFEELEECTYSAKLIGTLGQQEFMTCDCVEQWDPVLKTNVACSEDSNCINRVTSVECVNGLCTCGDDCQNQRFQKRQYAAVSVIQTEKKGYGLRADAVIPEGGFVYEYIGEVIDEHKFRERMVEYDAKKFKHFYFMMLKNDSFIDATLKGSLARFCNHSCNPNAYVDKWVVGDKLRMGIFAKRAILQGEEITFDYNVDRYGAQLQPCYCGEPNCIKFMGGKTQTDAALLLPDGIAEALGVTPKQERKWLKENKHLRSKQQSDDAVINEQFVQSLEVEELQTSDVSKVMGALMKSQDLYVVRKLVERIYITSDNAVNLLIVRMHGYKTFSTVLQHFQDVDLELVKQILEILGKWPTMTRNKISLSQIENVVRALGEKSDDNEIKALCTTLLEQWGKLQMAYRIPKSASRKDSGYSRRDDRSDSYSRRDDRSDSYSKNEHEGSTDGHSVLASRTGSPEKASVEDDAPLPGGWEVAYDENSKSVYYFHRALNLSRWERPVAEVPTGPKSNDKKEKREHKRERRDKEASLARQEEERLRALREEQFNKLQERERELKELIDMGIAEGRNKEVQKPKLDKEKLHKRKLSLDKSKEKSKEKSKDKSLDRSKEKPSAEVKWTRLFAAHIPNLIKKHEKEIGRENLKGCAKDFVHMLVEKEKLKGLEPPRELDAHKLKKVKAFCATLMEKFLIKYRAKRAKRKGDEEGGDRKRKKGEKEEHKNEENGEKGEGK